MKQSGSMLPALIVAVPALAAHLGCTSRLAGSTSPDAECRVASTSERVLPARVELERLRAARGGAPYSRDVTAVIASTASSSGAFSLRARGALAVWPGHAARLVLVGAGGVTALDAWVTATAYRVQSPDRLFRSDSVAPEHTPAIEAPVYLLRVAFVRPLAGTLAFVCDGDPWTVGLVDRGVHSRVTSTPVQLRLNSGTAVLTLADAPAGTGEHSDGVSGAGERAEYVDTKASIRVVVEAGPRASEPPDAVVFEDPDRAVQR